MNKKVKTMLGVIAAKAGIQPLKARAPAFARATCMDGD